MGKLKTSIKWPKSGLPLDKALEQIAKDNPTSDIAKLWREYKNAWAAFQLARDDVTDDEADELWRKRRK